MSSSWFPEPFELDVEEPGCGVIEFGVRRDGDAETRRGRLTGPKIGAALRAVTTLVLDEHDTSPEVPGLGRISHTEARKLLPPLQHAALLAGAGTDRYERMVTFDDDAPVDPLCVYCCVGSDYTPNVDTENPWCDKHGHTPFGEYAGMKWEKALTVHARRRDWWERMQALRAPRVIPPDAVTVVPLIGKAR